MSGRHLAHLSRTQRLIHRLLWGSAIARFLRVRAEAGIHEFLGEPNAKGERWVRRVFNGRTRYGFEFCGRMRMTPWIGKEIAR